MRKKTPAETFNGILIMPAKTTTKIEMMKSLKYQLTRQIAEQKQNGSQSNSSNSSLEELRNSYIEQLRAKEVILIQLKQKRNSHTDSLDDLMFDLQCSQAQLDLKQNEMKVIDSSIRSLMDSIQKQKKHQQNNRLNTSQQSEDTQRQSSFSYVRQIMKGTKNILEENLDRLEKFNTSRVHHD